MKIIKADPAFGKKPRRITCAGCGKRAPEAGVALPEAAVERGYGVSFTPGLPSGPVMIVEDADLEQPLCAACVNALTAAGGKP